MALLDKIFGGGLGSLVKDVVGLFKLPPEKKAELEALVEAHAHELAVKQVELESKIADFQAREIEAAGANIRAEAQSGDKFTSRARPTFLYIANFIILWNYVVAPLLSRPVLDFPEPLFWLFGSVMLGYVGARSWEKYNFHKTGK